MQKYRNEFSDPTHTGVLTDNQHCLRLNDLSEIGDGTHYLDFHMLGLFSFRNWTLQQGVDFWMEFLHSLEIFPDTVTIHPDKPQWRSLYNNYCVEVLTDPGCTWTDGDGTGYCTEFYLRGVEIGNIVNPGGDCLDCGFGLERLEMFVSPIPPPPPQDILFRTIGVLLENGVEPGNRKQRYVLRSLIRQQVRMGGRLPSHVYVSQEMTRLDKVLSRLIGLRTRHPGKSKQYFWETHGIHPDDWP